MPRKITSETFKRYKEASPWLKKLTEQQQMTLRRWAPLAPKDGALQKTYAAAVK